MIVWTGRKLIPLHRLLVETHPVFVIGWLDSDHPARRVRRFDIRSNPPIQLEHGTSGRA